MSWKLIVGLTNSLTSITTKSTIRLITIERLMCSSWTVLISFFPMLPISWISNQLVTILSCMPGKVTTFTPFAFKTLTSITCFYRIFMHLHSYKYSFMTYYCNTSKLLNLIFHYHFICLTEYRCHPFISIYFLAWSYALFSPLRNYISLNWYRWSAYPLDLGQLHDGAGITTLYSLQKFFILMK